MMVKGARRESKERKSAARPRPRAATAPEPMAPIPKVSVYGEATLQDTQVVIIQADDWEALMDWMEDLRSAERFEEARREPPEAFIPYAEVKRRLWKNNIKKVRMAKGMKQKELAEALECQPSYISKIEKQDYRPWASTLEKVAEALGCEVEELI